MDTDIKVDKHRKSRIPRKIMTVRPSKYDIAEAIHANKKYWKNVFDEIDKKAQENIEESKDIAKVLPSDIYKKVCNTLDIPIIHDDDYKTDKIKEKPVRRALKEPYLSIRKSLYIERELDSDTDVEFCPSDEEEDKTSNIHKELLSKPERDQVTWASHYLQPEREDEKTLIRKADDLTDRIATEFCKYMKELGGNQQSQLFTPKAIKELFQIEFDTHVARGLRVVPKELPCILDKVADVTGHPEKARTAALEREISRDIKAEKRPDRIKAFGHSLPQKDRWRTPKNETKKLWRSARHVPRDLVTLKTVWEGITHLRSVKEYCRWMIKHPEYRRAPYLNSLGMFDSAVLDARLTFELEVGQAGIQGLHARSDEAPAPIEEIKRRLSELVENV